MPLAFSPRWTAGALAALLCLGPGCKRDEEGPPPLTKEVGPFLRWCEAQPEARNPCLVSAARLTGDPAACGRIKPGAPDRTACLTAAARTSGRVDACRPLADRDLVLCALTVAAEQGRTSACDALEGVHWQGGAPKAVCLAVARGSAEACSGGGLSPDLRRLCLGTLPLRLRDPAACAELGKDTPDAHRCLAAVAVARRTAAECASLGAAARRGCEVEVEIARGRYPPCFGEPSACERTLWVEHPCEGTSGTWADDCRIHQAVFGTAPYGCGVVQDAKRRALCGELRDAQEGLTLRVRGADAGPRPASSR